MKIKTALYKLTPPIAILAPSLALAEDKDIENLWRLVGPWYNQFLLPIGAILAGLVVLFGGIMYITSAGDSGRTTRAKELIFGALTGLLVLVCAALIIRTIIA